MGKTLPTAPTDQPAFLIIAGPNGSGKSTAYKKSIVAASGRAFRIINPDLFAARIATLEARDPGDANLEAVRRIEAWLETSLLAGHTVGVETVLSTDKYRRLVTTARNIGHEFQFIYVMLDDPDRNIARIRTRVANGGHPVPDDKVRARYARSLEQLPWFLDAADHALLYDNSGAVPRLVGEKKHGFTRLADTAPDALRSALTIA
jgi:predicted ABC-type ATPase